jgi:hypothetical protein
MRYEQKAELQDSNKARMYEKKKKQKKTIKVSDYDKAYSSIDFNFGTLDLNDVMNLAREITYRLQDLKLIKGNNKNYNFEVDDEIKEIICKKLNIKEK